MARGFFWIGSVRRSAYDERLAAIICWIFNTLFQLRPVVGDPQALSMKAGLSFESWIPSAP